MATPHPKGKSRRLTVCKEQEKRRESEREILKRELQKFREKVTYQTRNVLVPTDTRSMHILARVLGNANAHSVSSPRTRPW